MIPFPKINKFFSLISDSEVFHVLLSIIILLASIFYFNFWYRFNFQYLGEKTNLKLEFRLFRIKIGCGFCSRIKIFKGLWKYHFCDVFLNSSLFIFEIIRECGGKTITSEMGFSFFMRCSSNDKLDAVFGLLAISFLSNLGLILKRYLPSITSSCSLLNWMIGSPALIVELCPLQMDILWAICHRLRMDESTSL